MMKAAIYRDKSAANVNKLQRFYKLIQRI